MRYFQKGRSGTRPAMRPAMRTDVLRILDRSKKVSMLDAEPPTQRRPDLAEAWAARMNDVVEVVR